MAERSFVVTATRAEPEPPRLLVRLEMSEEVAASLLAILGNITGGGPAREHSAAIYSALTKLRPPRALQGFQGEWLENDQ